MTLEPHTIATSPRPRVVVVEDDPALRESIEYALEVEGYPVIACASGEALVALPLDGAGPTCLVVDYHLGGMDGMTALEILRARGVDLPTIIITTAPNLVLREWARDTKATLVEKPLLEDVLVGAIRRLTGPGTPERPAPL